MATVKIRTVGGVFALVVAFGLSGCTALVGALQGAIGKNSEVPVEVITVTTKLPEVVACIEHQGGMCTAAEGIDAIPLHISQDVCNTLRTYATEESSLSLRAICDPTASKLENIMNAAAGRKIEDPNVSLSRVGSRTFAKTLYDAANTHSWSQIKTTLSVRVQALHSKALTSSLSSAEVIEQRNVLRAATLSSTMEAYFNDYFNGGKFVSLTIDPSDKTASAEKELQNKLGMSANSAKEAVNDVLNLVTGTPLGSDGMYHIVTAKSGGGFVTRGGNNYVFPTVSFTITPGARKDFSASKIDFSAVGADLMRVYVEALGDYWAQLPGVSQSSGVKAGLLRTFGADPKKEQLNEDQFKEVNDWSSSAEAAAGNGTGQLIRGIAWLSINNEALAKVIETAVGVAVRKASEKVTWCVEACAKVNERDQFQNGIGSITKTQVIVLE